MFALDVARCVTVALSLLAVLGQGGPGDTPLPPPPTAAAPFSVAGSLHQFLPAPTPWNETKAEVLFGEFRRLCRGTEAGRLLRAALEEVERGPDPEHRLFWHPYAAGTRAVGSFFRRWLKYAPVPDVADVADDVPNGPGFYMVQWDYLANTEAGLELTHGHSAFKGWFLAFLGLHAEWLNSPESNTTMGQWMEYRGTSRHPFRIEDYEVPPGGFQTFNQFFLREFKDPDQTRPLGGAADPGAIVSPNDGGLFFLADGSALPGKRGDVFDVRGTFPVHGRRFVGGTLLDSLLWLTDYHHFVAPVGGRIVEEGDYMGSYNYDFGARCQATDDDGAEPLLDSPRHDGGNGSSQHTSFRPETGRAGWYKNMSGHRRYNWVIDTGIDQIGLVGMSAIGFWDVGSIAMDLPPPGEGQFLSRGDRVGHFNFGASSIVLAFEPRANISWAVDGMDLSGPERPTPVRIKQQIGQAWLG